MDILGLSSPPEEEQIIEDVPVVEAPPQYATVDQMQSMVQGVAAQLQENLVNLMQGGQRQEQPQQMQHALPEPTLEEIQTAMEEGDTRRYIQLQGQREAARDQRYQSEMYRLRAEGQQAFDAVNGRMLPNLVPDYKRYEKEVDKMIKDLGLPANTRQNPQLVELLTNSVKGSKMEDLLAERIEAQKRQETLEATSAPSGNRSNPTNAPPRKVFSDEALVALKTIGKDQETFAKTRGHGSWQEYESNAAAYQAAKRGEGNYTPKWRRNKK